MRASNGPADKRYVDGSELIVENGLSLQHAQRLARRYAELEPSAEYSYVAQEDPEPLLVALYEGGR